MKKQVVETVFDGKQLFYVDFGDNFVRGSDPQLRLWIDKSFLTKENNKWFVEFPIRNCDVIEMENKKDLIIKHGDSNLFYFYIVPGGKGKSVIDSIDIDQSYKVFMFTDDDIDRMTTSKGIIILTKANRVKLKWHRDGDFYDLKYWLKNGSIDSLGYNLLPEGITLLYSDGKIETIPNDKVVEYL